MLDTVDRVLDLRLQRPGRRSWITALLAATALHLAAAASGWILHYLRQAPPPHPRILAVRVVPAQRLGNPEAPRERAAPQRPRPPAPEPKPEAKQPQPKPAAPPPKPEDKPSEPQAAAQESPPEKVAQASAEPGPRGSPQGNPLGTSSFGARVAGLDNPAFTYDYYLDRILAMIEAQWVRPPTEGSVETTIFFRIAKDGSVSELRVVTESGFRAFDLAALRAVQKAAPLPPLPRSYRQDSLGVNLIVR